MRRAAAMAMLLSTACRPPAPAPGEPGVSEAIEHTAPTPTPTPAMAEELRGVWMTRFTYRSEDEVRRAIDEIADAGFNAVFFQVRGSFDAWYDSELEPWAAPLSGRLGQDPGWDPLAVAVEAGHARGLAVHAWLNSLPLWRGEVPPAVPAHAWHAEPTWRMAGPDGAAMALNEHYVFADPAVPEVRAHLAAVAADIEDRYAVDGIHLDYIRYPEGAASELSPEVARGHITETVRAVSEATERPLSAAVWGVYENRWGWERVMEGRDDLHQDSHAWLAEGLVDALMPMIYFSVKAPGERLDFATLAADHLDRAAGKPVFMGISAEHLSEEEVLGCVEAARTAGAPGVVVFDWSLGRAHYDALAAGPFAQPAQAPTLRPR